MYKKTIFIDIGPRSILIENKFNFRFSVFFDNKKNIIYRLVDFENKILNIIYFYAKNIIKKQLLVIRIICILYFLHDVGYINMAIRIKTKKNYLFARKQFFLILKFDKTFFNRL